MKSIYSTQDWKSEDPLGRGELILVLERVKPGTTTYFSNPSFLESILEQYGLAMECENPSRHTYSIASSERLREWNEKHEANMQRYDDFVSSNNIVLSEPCSADIYRKSKWLVEKIDRESDRINGEFYGYPSCCVEAYAQRYNSNRYKRYLDSSIPKIRARARKSRTLKYYSIDSYKSRILNPILNFAPPSFTPCKNDCKNAIELLAKYKELLESLDPEAASALVNLNFQR